MRPAVLTALIIATALFMENMDGTVLPLTNGVWFWSVCVAVSAWTLVQRHDRGLSIRP